MPIYLATKEILRNQFRFLAICLVIALITLLVLFISALGAGLANASKEYIEGIPSEMIVFQEDVDLSIPGSRLGRSILNDLQRLPEVEAVGPIGFSTATILLEGGEENLDVALIGVEPGLPGSPAVSAGQPLVSRRANEVVLDQNVLNRVEAEIQIGQQISIKVTQGTQEKVYQLTVVGFTRGSQYAFLPGVFVPLLTWNKVRPQSTVEANSNELIFNIAALKLRPTTSFDTALVTIPAVVRGIELTDPVTAYEASPGYAEQQSTITTQQSFIVLIAMLVIGGFFQIQTLQKIGQIGMLKAIGTPNRLIVLTLMAQVTITTIIGLALGTAASFLLALGLPPGIPITFEENAVLTSLVTLFLMGPLSGLVSIRTLLKVEPLAALGLSN